MIMIILIIAKITKMIIIVIIIKTIKIHERDWLSQATILGTNSTVHSSCLFMG